MIRALIFLFLFLPVKSFAALSVPSNIYIEAPKESQILRIQRALVELSSSSVGKKIIEEIASTPHTLRIQHEPLALSSVGKTLLPLTRKLSNGVGASAVIQMNFDIPSGGSHLVSECTTGWTSFTFLMNLLHELRHARDGMTGNFVGHRFEEDAVVSENELRKEMGIQQRRCLMEDEENVLQIWWPLNFSESWSFKHGVSLILLD